MAQETFQPGDEVYHVSDSKLIMAVESVSEKGVFCTWIHPKTYEHREGIYQPTSLRKKFKGLGIQAIGGLP